VVTARSASVMIQMRPEGGVAHNHPNGDPATSQADIRATRQLKEAAKTMQIDLLDHLIVGTKDADPCNIGYFSFSEAGLI
jgi:DNA repair protein RadC